MTTNDVNALSKITTTLCLGALAYLLSPIFFQVKYIPQPPSNIANPIILGTIAIFLLAISLELGTELYQKKFKNKGWWILGLPIKAIMGLLAISMLSNHFAWKKTPLEISNLEKRVENATPEQITAGKTFLEINEKSDPELFFTTLEPLLVQQDWVFPLDDPTEYLIDGEKGESTNTEPKWKYTLPLEATKQNIDGLIKLAEENADEGNEKEAARKIAVTLGTGNRLAEQPQFIASQIGTYILNKSTKLLQKYPQLASNSQIQKEITRAENIIKVTNDSLWEECNTINRQIEEVAHNNEQLTVGSFTIPPQPMTKTFQNWIEYKNQNPENGVRFVRKEQIKLIAQFQPIQAIFIGQGLPFTNTVTEKSEELQTRVENLQKTL